MYKAKVVDGVQCVCVCLLGFYPRGGGECVLNASRTISDVHKQAWTFKFYSLWAIIDGSEANANFVNYLHYEKARSTRKKSFPNTKCLGWEERVEYRLDGVFHRVLGVVPMGEKVGGSGFIDGRRPLGVWIKCQGERSEYVLRLSSAP